MPVEGARDWGLTIAPMAPFVATNLIVLVMHLMPGPSAPIFIAQSIVVVAISASPIKWNAVWWHSTAIAAFLIWGSCGKRRPDCGLTCFAV